MAQQEVWFIKKTFLRNRIATAGKIQGLLNNTQEKPVSKNTVKRWLASNELNGRWQSQNPFYDPKINATDCYMPRSTSIILSMTGKKFCLQMNPKFILIDRFVSTCRSNKRMLKECVKFKVKHGGGCFSKIGVGDLFRINDILTEEKYQSILQRHAIPSGLKLCSHRFVLQQDNHPKHTYAL